MSIIVGHPAPQSHRSIEVFKACYFFSSRANEKNEQIENVIPRRGSSRGTLKRTHELNTEVICYVNLNSHSLLGQYKQCSFT